MVIVNFAMLCTAYKLSCMSDVCRIDNVSWVFPTMI